jgi:hypothetical protein
MVSCGSALTISDSPLMTVALYRKKLLERPSPHPILRSVGFQFWTQGDLCRAGRSAGASSLQSRLLKRLGPESGGADFAWLAKHLVDLACVQLFGVDHLPRVFLEHHRRPLHG